MAIGAGSAAIMGAERRFGAVSPGPSLGAKRDGRRNDAGFTGNGRGGGGLGGTDGQAGVEDRANCVVDGAP